MTDINSAAELAVGDLVRVKGEDSTGSWSDALCVVVEPQYHANGYTFVRVKRISDGKLGGWNANNLEIADEEG